MEASALVLATPTWDPSDPPLTTLLDATGFTDTPVLLSV